MGLYHSPNHLPLPQPQPSSDDEHKEWRENGGENPQRTDYWQGISAMRAAQFPRLKPRAASPANAELHWYAVKLPVGGFLIPPESQPLSRSFRIVRVSASLAT